MDEIKKRFEILEKEHKESLEALSEIKTSMTQLTTLFHEIKLMRKAFKESKPSRFKVAFLLCLGAALPYFFILIYSVITA